MTIFRSETVPNDRLLTAGRIIWYFGLLSALGCWIGWKILRNRLASGAVLATPVQQRTHEIAEGGQAFLVNSADAQLHWIGSVGFFVSLGVALIGLLLIRRAKSNQR